MLLLYVVEVTKGVEFMAKKNIGKSVFSIKYKMILGIGIPLFIVLGVIGAILHSQTVDMVEDLKKIEINAQVSTAGGQVNAFFQPFMVGAAQLADFDSIYDYVVDANANPTRNMNESSYYGPVLNELKEALDNYDSALTGICVVPSDAKQLLSSDGSVLIGFDPNTRAWYDQVKKSNGKSIISAAYTDAVTGKTVVSACVGIYEHGSNRLIGAIVFDVALDGLIKELSTIAIGEEGYLTVYDRDGVILYHPNSDLIMQTIEDVNYSENMYSVLHNNQTAEAMEYTRNNIPYCGAVEYLSDIEWRVLGCMTSEEYVQEATSMTKLVVASFVCCALLYVLCRL